MADPTVNMNVDKAGCDYLAFCINCLVRSRHETADPCDLSVLDRDRTPKPRIAGAVEQARGAVSSASSVAGESRVVAPFDGRVVARVYELSESVQAHSAAG